MANIFTGLGKIDDWQFEAVVPGELNYQQIQQSIFQEYPFSEAWYFYLLAGLVIVLFLISVAIFFHGLFIRIKYRQDLVLKAKGNHKMLLGLPALVFLVIPISLIWWFDNLYDVREKTLVYFFGSILVLIAVLLLGSLISGIYHWIKFRTNNELKKTGRNQVIFFFYNLIVVSAFAFLVLFTVSISTSKVYNAVSYGPNLANPTGAGPFGLNDMASANLGSRGPSYQQDNIGFSVGGAKDIDNFRENIKNNFLPIPTDVTYEGLYYDYFFDTGQSEPCEKLFCPSYTSAISKDPFSGQDEYLLSVGLNSGIKQEDFNRKKLNLIVVLDISGSMSSPFNRYYYDQFGKQQELFNEAEENKADLAKTKMQIAAESAVALLEHLNPEDSFGMVLFDDVSYLAKPLRLVGETDMSAIKDHILEIQPQGSTNMTAGMEEATKQFNEYLEVDSEEYENRVIFLTDAQPNTGDITDEGMLGIAKGNADQKIYSTFIGIGLDFNTELVEQITKIRGANYYSVHSPAEFKERMDEGFDYMVTPLVFDLQLTIEAPGFVIKEVYGSPEANEATGEIMKVNTLFPSKREDGETKGGLVLLHLKRISDDNSIKLTAAYKDRNNQAATNSVSLMFENQTEYYSNTGIRKGIVLARYASLVKNWLLAEREAIPPTEPVVIEPPVRLLDVYYQEGIPIMDSEFTLGRWERQSEALRVSDNYKQLFTEFVPYFEREMTAIGDQSMIKELDLLKQLANYLSLPKE